MDAGLSPQASDLRWAQQLLLEEELVGHLPQALQS